jgi:mono/diheme cytochrome c family protein
MVVFFRRALFDRSFFALAFTALVLTACQPGLERQPKVKEDEQATFFANQSGARPLPPGTVSYLAPTLAKPKITRELLELGQARYEIYCSVCHGLTGDGDGLATQRGFPKPESFHSEKNRMLTAEAIEQIIARGKDAMLGFADRVPATDRGAISEYVKALQLRAHFPKKELREGEQ